MEEDGAGVHAVLFGVAGRAGLALGRGGARRVGGSVQGGGIGAEIVFHAFSVTQRSKGAAARIRVSR